MTIISSPKPDVNPASYSAIAKEAEQLGFTLGRARRSGAYPLLWTTPGGNYHAFVKSLDKVLPFIAAVLAENSVAEGGLK